MGLVVEPDYVRIAQCRKRNKPGGRGQVLSQNGSPVFSPQPQCQLEHDNWPCQEVILRGKGGRGASLLPDE